MSQPSVLRAAEQTAAVSQPAGGALSTLIAACVSGFLFQFDLTALSAALPDIASSLSARVADQAWVIDVYKPRRIRTKPFCWPDEMNSQQGPANRRPVPKSMREKSVVEAAEIVIALFCGGVLGVLSVKAHSRADDWLVRARSVRSMYQQAK